MNVCSSAQLGIINAAHINIFAHNTVIQHFMFLSKEQGCSHPLIAVSLVYDECFLLGSCAFAHPLHLQSLS